MTRSRILWNVGEKPPRYEDFHCDMCKGKVLYIYVFVDLNHVEKHEFLAVCNTHYLSDSDDPPKWFCSRTFSSEKSLTHFFTTMVFEGVMES